MSAPIRTWLTADLGQVVYKDAHRLQLDLVVARQGGSLEKDIILLLEHPPVFTLGLRGNRRNLKINEKMLYQLQMDIVSVERGGDITFHGPGQLVGYMIVSLETNGLDVSRFVWSLEEVMIRTAADFCLPAFRDPRNPGVWVKEKKLGNIGIAVRKGITFHGFAMNVCNDLTPFSWINPCGLKAVGVTSLSAGKTQKVRLQDVKSRILAHISDVFCVQLETTNHLLTEILPQSSR